MPLEIRPFLNLVLSFEESIRLSVPVLHNLASLAAKTESQRRSTVVSRESVLSEALLSDGLFLSEGLLYRRINRHYLRLCRVTGELDRLDFKKASQGSLKDFALEDFVFSGIDFSRYREIDGAGFDIFSLEALTDFSDEFYKKNFGLCRREVQSVIEGNYKKTIGQNKTTDKYTLMRENPLILSVMRALEISLENSPLFTIEEISKEVEKLPCLGGKKNVIPEINALYHLLVSSLDKVSVTHGDGMVTKLFISSEGELSGTFRPGNKPWTRVLIPRWEWGVGR